MPRPFIPSPMGSIITGTVADYATLPSPASAHTGELWFVEAGSGGFLSALTIYKYPKGLYSPNASDVWQLVPINVKVSEDSLTLVNIANWSEYIGYAFDIASGDTLIYNGIKYKNLTGTQTSTAPDTDTTNWKVSGVMSENTEGYIYINGDSTTEGSRRFSINIDTSFPTVEKLIAGIWQPTSLQTGPNSILVGINVGIAAAGDHIMTEATDGKLHLHAHSEFDGQLSTGQAKIVDAFANEVRAVQQPDNTGLFTGTVMEFAFPASGHSFLAKVYYQTGATAATELIRYRGLAASGSDLTSGVLVVGEYYAIATYVAGDDFTNVGADSNKTTTIFKATGTTPTVWTNSSTIAELRLIFDQSYPSSKFPASSEVSLDADGFLETLSGITYYTRIESIANISIKMDASNTFPWLAVDESSLHEDNLLQTVEWISGDTFAEDQWTVQSRKIYICNTAGVQTGTFASNIALWDLLSHEGNDFWTRSGTTLNTKTAGDAVQIGNLNINANTITSFSGNTNIASIAGNTIVSSAISTTISAADNINVTAGSAGRITLTTSDNKIVLDTQGPGGAIELTQLTASSGLYLDASKNITNTAPTSGDLGYWNKTGTTLSTAPSDLTIIRFDIGGVEKWRMLANRIEPATTTTSIGIDAGLVNTGADNTYIGNEAGKSNIVGVGGVSIGNQAGANETTSNKLYIANSSTSDPLIYGEFDTPLVKINGAIETTATIPPIGNSLTTAVQKYTSHFDGQYLYISLWGTSGIEKYDVTSTDTPISVGSITGVANTFQARDVVSSGQYVYLAAQAGSLTIFDRETLVQVGQLFDLGTLGSLSRVVVRGTIAYVSGSSGVKSIDVSDPTNPFFLKVVTTNLTGVNGIDIQGRYLFAHATSRITIFDLDSVGADRGSMVETGSLLDATNLGTTPIGIKVEGNYAYLTAYSLGAMTIINVKDKTAPVYSGKVTGISQCYSLVVDQDRVYAVGQNAQKLYIINTSDKTTPVIEAESDIDANILNSLSLQVFGNRATVSTFLSKNVLMHLGGSVVTNLVAGNIRTSRAYIDSELYSENANIRDSLSVGKNVRIDGELSAASIKTTGDLTASGDTFLTGSKVEVAGTLEVTGYAEMNGTLKAGMTADSTIPLIADTSLSNTALVNTRFVNDVYKAGDAKNAVAAVATADHPRTGHPTLHGYTTVTNDRVLLTGQTNAEENGSYIAASGSWARADDWDETLNARAGGQFTVANPGTTKNGYQYVCTTQGTIVINVTETAWFEISPREMTSIDGTNILAVSNTTTSISKSLQYNIAMAAPSYVAGQTWYDSVSKGHVLDTGYTDVRLNAGREQHLEVYNSSGSLISNGDPVSVTGTVTGTMPNVVPMDSSSILLALGFAGVATMDIANGASGIVATRGDVNDVNTGALALGFIYADSAGGYTQTRPLYPEQRLLIGGVLKTGVTDGIISVGAQIIARNNASRSYNFTSNGVSAGTYYKGGFYDWNASSVALTQVSLTQTYGTVSRAYAAHAGIVPSAAGTVDTGQVGLRVTGIEDSETGIQVAAQTGIITEDITTLTANVMAETSGKFSGQVTYELYVVSGVPTAYSLTFNYGYSKYEDMQNQDATITALECHWQGGATDTGFDVVLLHHTAIGWTYAATGFVAGNGYIAKKSVDQPLAGNVVNGQDGAWKRTNLNFFVDGNGSEGVLFEITTTQNNTIQTMDLHVIGVSEEL